MITRTFLIKASVFILCALFARDAVRIVAAIIALNPFFSRPVPGGATPTGISIDLAIWSGGKKILIPTGLFVWSVLAYGQWKTNGGWTFFVGLAAAGAILLRLGLIYINVVKVRDGFLFVTGLRPLDCGFLGMLLLVLVCLSLSLKRFEQRPIGGDPI